MTRSTRSSTSQNRSTRSFPAKTTNQNHGNPKSTATKIRTARKLPACQHKSNVATTRTKTKRITQKRSARHRSPSSDDDTNSSTSLSDEEEKIFTTRPRRRTAVSSSSNKSKPKINYRDVSDSDDDDDDDGDDEGNETSITQEESDETDENDEPEEEEYTDTKISRGRTKQSKRKTPPKAKHQQSNDNQDEEPLESQPLESPPSKALGKAIKTASSLSPLQCDEYDTTYSPTYDNDWRTTSVIDW